MTVHRIVFIQLHLRYRPQALLHCSRNRIIDQIYILKSMSHRIDDLSGCISFSYHAAYFIQSNHAGPGMFSSDVLEEIDLRPYSRTSDMNALAVKRSQAAWSGTGTILQAPVYPGQKSSGTGGTYVLTEQTLALRMFG
jgi:hypothetical protein